jgi:hypothetical protein
MICPKRPIKNWPNNTSDNLWQPKYESGPMSIEEYKKHICPQHNPNCTNCEKEIKEAERKLFKIKIRRNPKFSEYVDKAVSEVAPEIPVFQEQELYEENNAAHADYSNLPEANMLTTPEKFEIVQKAQARAQADEDIDSTP